MGLTVDASEMRELASGVDAFYLSGKGSLPTPLLDRLEAARTDAVEANAARSFSLGGYDFMLQPRSLLKYRYRLDHPAAAVGLTPSQHLPVVWIQPRAEALHSIGPEAVLNWANGLLQNEGAAVKLGVARLDLHADWQGWQLGGDDRHRFVCRADDLTTIEHKFELGGFTFGTRNTGSVTARIYDKTLEIAGNGHDWWIDRWGSAFEEGKPVLRVEFEFQRAGLRELGLSDPLDTLAAAGAVWAYATEWLSYRTPSGHAKRDRWPVAPEWEAIMASSLAQGCLPRSRIEASKSRGGLRLIMPQLNGYMTSFASFTGASTIDDACAKLPSHLKAYEQKSGRSFGDRVDEKKAKRQ